MTTVATRRAQGTTVFGYVLFVGLVAGGYFYNLTFVQLGLVDLGTRVVGLTPDRVAAHLGILAGGTLVVALAAESRCTARVAAPVSSPSCGCCP